MFHANGDNAQQQKGRSLAKTLDVHVCGNHDKWKLGHFLGAELVQKFISLAETDQAAQDGFPRCLVAGSGTFPSVVDGWRRIWRMRGRGCAGERSFVGNLAWLDGISLRPV